MCPTGIKMLAGKNQSNWESFSHIHAIPLAVSLAPIYFSLHPLPFMLPAKIWKWWCMESLNMKR